MVLQCIIFTGVFTAKYTFKLGINYPRALSAPFYRVFSIIISVWDGDFDDRIGLYFLVSEQHMFLFHLYKY